MKLTKVQSKLHKEAEEMLEKEELTYEEKVFVMTHWQEGATNMNGIHGAFFTPIEFAKDFSIEVHKNKVIDLCAGIGTLSFYAMTHGGCSDITCLEWNKDYIRVGKKILPEANWIHGSVLNQELINSLGKFEIAISNPPFGNIKGSDDGSWLNYKGSEFEYKVIEVASKIAANGTFIIPQQSSSFRLSGERCFRTESSQKLEKFMKETGIELEPNCGIDTSIYRDQWKGVNPMCEIVLCDFRDVKENF